MDNNKYLPKSKWDCEQPPPSLSFKQNIHDNMPDSKNLHWYQPQSSTNNAQHTDFLNERDSFKYNSQMKATRTTSFQATSPMNHPEIHAYPQSPSARPPLPMLHQTSVYHAQQSHQQQVRFPPNSGQNLRMPPPNMHTIGMAQTERTNCAVAQSFSGTVHGPPSLPPNRHPSSLNYASSSIPYNQSINSTATLQTPHLNNAPQTQINAVTVTPARQPLNTKMFFETPYQAPPMGNAPNLFNRDFIRQPPPNCMPPNLIFDHSSASESATHGTVTSAPISQGAAFSNPFPIMHQSFTPTVPGRENTNITKLGGKDNSNWEDETQLLKFLEKFRVKQKDQRKKNITVLQYRTVLKQGLSLIKNLDMCKDNLTKLLRLNEKSWDYEIKKLLQFQNQLTNICRLLTSPLNLNYIKEKLRRIQKYRAMKKRLKARALDEKIMTQKRREELHQEIDKWLDSIKEKNLKLKREVEMKKEADIILSEVRRKIHEAKRTLEKIKVFEKLRNTRQASAVQKGLFVPEHSEKFQSIISDLRETMLKQLADYENEERAMKVMLEAEQEGQLEEEALWKIKKQRTLQQKRQNNIIQCLFGDSVEEPVTENPIFLFYQYQNAGNKSVESLVQIRHHWDMHISENGEPVPHHWIVPVPPSSPAWEVAHDS